MTLVEEAYNFILNKIKNQEWLPGYPLIEQDLSKTLDMSRTPIRQALHRLAEDGYVEHVENKGIHVSYKNLSQKEVQERLEFLELMVNHYLRRLQTQEYDFPTDQTQAVLDQLKEIPPSDYGAFFEQELVFLDSLLHKVENEYYVALVHQTILSLMEQKGQTKRVIMESRPEIVDHYQQLTDYLKDNDYPYARREIRILINQIILNVFQGPR